MIKNYWLVAWRNLLRNRLHTGINIAGLSIGISACLVIYLIVSYELSFNRGHQHYDRIYRIHSSFSGTFSGLNRGVPTAVAPALKEQFTGIDAVAFLHGFSSDVTIPAKDERKKFKTPTTSIITEPSYFDIFPYEWIAGTPEVLAKPAQVVLTEAAALRYFNSTDPQAVIDREVVYQDSLSVTVAGLVRDPSFHTDIDFSDFISGATLEQSWLKNRIQLNDWTSVNSSSQVFLRLAPGTTREKVESQMPLLMELYKKNSDWDVANNFTLQALRDMHYDSEVGIFDHSRSAAHMPTLMALIGVAVLLLVIGSINFINLETAQSLRRAKEVGVRKVLGSTRAKLIGQFLAESMIVTLVAILLALPLTELALGYFSEFVPEGVTLQLMQAMPFLVAVMLVIGLLAGLYPAFILSSFLPALALKNQVYSTRGGQASFLRKSLIVFQFIGAQVLIIGTLVINTQVRYMLNKDLGFRKDAVIYFSAPWWEQHTKATVLQNKLTGIAEIESMSMSDAPPSANGWSSSTVTYTREGGDVNVNAYRKFGDTHYIQFYGMQLLSGRDLVPSDTAREFIINETLLHTLGFEKPEEAIGKEIVYSRSRLPIVGVVKDFHIQSLRTKVEPVIIANSGKSFYCFNIRLHSAGDTENFTNGIKQIEAAWKEVFPDAPFEYTFLDETVRNFYQTEQRTAKLANTATALAVLISCLGLFGLVSYTTVQRTKEIGIRKVMGASVQNIVLLLSREFITLVVIAFILAAPGAWYMGTHWLSSFAYQTEINVGLFIITALLAIVLAFVTVSYKTFRAANANPVDSLRTE